MEVKVIIENIAKLRTGTGVREEKDKNGKVEYRMLITKISFEAEIDPFALSDVHKLLASETPVYVIIGSTQTSMDIAKREGIFAGT